jgi:hypothetical protein
VVPESQKLKPRLVPRAYVFDRCNLLPFISEFVNAIVRRNVAVGKFEIVRCVGRRGKEVPDRRCPTGFPRSLDLTGGDLRGEMGHMPVILRCDGAQKFSRLLDIGDVRLHFLITRSQ